MNVLFFRRAMPAPKKYLLALFAFTVIFLLLVVCGSLLWSWSYRRAAFACFALAMLAVFGQVFSLLLYAYARR